MSEASFTERDEIKGSAADLKAWAQQQPAVGRCLFCPEIEWTGTADEIRALAEEHRAQCHPEAQRTRRRRPRAIAMRMSFNQTLNPEEAELVERARRQRMHMLGIDET